MKVKGQKCIERKDKLKMFFWSMHKVLASTDKLQSFKAIYI